MLSCKFIHTGYSYFNDDLDIQSDVLVKSLLDPIKSTLEDTVMRGLNGRGSAQAEELLYAQIDHWFEIMPFLNNLSAQFEFAEGVALHVLIQRPTEERKMLFSKIDTADLDDPNALFTPHSSFQDLFNATLANSSVAEINRRPIVGRSWETLITNATALLKYGL